MTAHDIDLVAEVHTLLNVLAPLDPDLREDVPSQRTGWHNTGFSIA